VSEALAVAVEALPVGVVTLDGARTDALVYLHTTSGRHSGPETLGERLGGNRGPFLPCKVADGTQLFNIDQVAVFDCPPDLPEIEELDELPAFRFAATLELVNGEQLAGELRYLLPPSGCRLSDLLNAADQRFLLLTGGDRSYYVNRRAVVRVRTEAPPWR
jgi:hypothetical protein